MKTYSSLINFATNLSQNSSGANQLLMSTLIDEQHRLLIEKYFDNEREFTTNTVGAQNLTLTAAPSAGATSATLTASWAYATGYADVTFSDGETQKVLFTQNSTAVTWGTGLQNAVTTAIQVLGMQEYNIPSNISKITNSTVMVGQMKFVPAPIQTRDEWDRVNFLPYNNDIPGYFFIYNSQLLIFPIPSTTGDVIQFNYKARVPDLSFAWYNNAGTYSAWTSGQTPTDYAQGTLAASGLTVGDVAVTGTSTAWNTAFPTGVDISWMNLYFRADPSGGGDGIWYPIRSFTDATHLTLVNPIMNAATITSSSTYSIGQMPVLQEDFHPMLAYGALMIYFGTIKPSPAQYKIFENEYNKRNSMLEDYAGTKQINVNLGDSPTQFNPNLVPYGNPNTQ